MAFVDAQLDRKRYPRGVSGDLDHIILFEPVKRFLQVGRQALGREDEFTTEELYGVSGRKTQKNVCKSTYLRKEGNLAQ